MRWRVCCIVLTVMALLVSACGSWKNLVRPSKPNIAVVDWEKAVRAHPKFIALEMAQSDVEAASERRDQQLALGRRQLALVQGMVRLKQSSKDNFNRAEFATKMAEKEAVERDRLRKLEEQLRAEAENKFVGNKQQVEQHYQLPILNIRMKLESLKLTEEAKNALLQELAELLKAKQQDMDAIEGMRQAYVQEQLGPEIEKTQQAMQAYAMSLQKAGLKQARGIQNSDLERMKQGPEELEKLIASMDKDIQVKQELYDVLYQNIENDINNVLQKMAHDKKYTLVLRDVKANISATDVTPEVTEQLKQITTEQ